MSTSTRRKIPCGSGPKKVHFLASVPNLTSFLGLLVNQFASPQVLCFFQRKLQGLLILSTGDATGTVWTGSLHCFIARLGTGRVHATTNAQKQKLVHSVEMVWTPNYFWQTSQPGFKSGTWSWLTVFSFLAMAVHNWLESAQTSYCFVDERKRYCIITKHTHWSRDIHCYQWLGSSLISVCIVS